MSFGLTSTILAAAVAPAGTFTVPYPSGMARADFVGSVGPHALIVNQTLYAAPADFNLTFGAASITVTSVTLTLAAGATVKLQCDAPSGDQDAPEVAYIGSVPTRIPRSNVTAVRRLDLGNPIATVATNLRAAAAVGGAGALALLISTLDVPRNIIITSAGNDTGITFTILGKDEYNVVMTEVVTGANAGVAAGKKAFKTITSITASGAAAGNVSVGVGNVLGLPIAVTVVGHVLKELQDDVLATAGTFVGALSNATKSTATTADVRGTYVPNSAPDGSKSYALIVAIDDPTALGNPQFAG